MIKIKHAPRILIMGNFAKKAFIMGVAYREILSIEVLYILFYRAFYMLLPYIYTPLDKSSIV